MLSAQVGTGRADKFVPIEVGTLYRRLVKMELDILVRCDLMYTYMTGI